MMSKKKFILAIFLEEIKIFIKPKKGHSIWSDLFKICDNHNTIYCKIDKLKIL